MFSFIKLKNFISFGNVEFNFKRTKTETKKFAAVYGENGSGKSNFVMAFELLAHSLHSFNEYEMSKKVREALGQAFEKTDKLELADQFYRIIQRNELINFLQQCRMIDCNEETVVEYGFMLNDIEGYYRLSFDERIESEELYYMTGAHRGKLFSISLDHDSINKKFSNTTFRTSAFRKEFGAEIDKYWGKHTCLGIIVNLMHTHNEQYISENIAQNLIDIIDLFGETTVLCKSSNRFESGAISKNEGIIDDLSSGVIPIEKESDLDLSENILRDFFTQAYSDIEDIYYEKKTLEKNIRYQLHAKKFIAGKIRDIDFESESAGTQSVLRISKALIAAMNGKTVIYDEIDSGIHDILMKNILCSIQEYITGQLIITTHNTLLLEAIDAKAAYIIYIDCEGNKEARCFSDYNIRIQDSNNIRNLYLKGVFGGVPYSSEIDYSFISESVTNRIRSEEEDNADL